MDLNQITPLILTFDEKENITRTLQPLSWTKEIVIIDSGSTDGTLDLARAAHPNVKICIRPFTSFADQCNFGLSQISTNWVLSLDADYLLTPGLIGEIEDLQPGSDLAGYSAEFRYCIFGRPLRSTIYPARTVLYRRDRAHYVEEGHGHRVIVDGPVQGLSNKIDHDDQKPFSRWLKEQQRYAKIEARHLLSEPLDNLNFQDRLRRMIVLAAPAIFVYLTFGRGLILNGWRGLYYVLQRTIAELLLSLQLILRHMKR